jgi:CubicO group peptidase (beta-lactamase class C family)
MNTRRICVNSLRRYCRPRSLCRPQAEALERRSLLAASNPLDSLTFKNSFQTLMEQYDLAQGSIALIQSGQAYSYTATNPEFNFGGNTPATPDQSSLFRIASISKTFTAMAILKLVQDGRLSLSSSALEDLGYTPGETISGRNPVTGAGVSVKLNDPELFRVTVKNLLQMTSGFQYNIPLKSEAIRHVESGDVTGVAGNYAALGFAGVPRGGQYTSPATTSQLINYSVFEMTKHPDLQVTAPGTSAYYDNLNYVVLGQIVADKSGSNSPTAAGKYMDYLDEEILKPLGISLATDAPGNAETAPVAIVGLGSTFRKTQYSSEVSYYPSAKQTPGPSVLPASNPHKKTLLPKISGCASQAYGNSKDLESNFGDAGLVATPTALAIVMNNLNQVYAGTATGPLTQRMVDRMLSEPMSKATNGEPDDETDYQYGPGYFGMGLGVSPRGDSHAVWTRDGDLAGTTTFFERYPDGTVFAATFNSTPTSESYRSTLESDLSQLLFSPPVAKSETVAAVAGVPDPIKVLAVDSDPNPVGNLNPASVMIPHNDYPNHGTLSINSATGVITYDADNGYTGADQFTYTVSDDFDRTAKATITINVI